MIAGVYGDSHDQNHERVSHYYEHEQKLNMTGIEMPMQCTERTIAKFTRQNDISVSVYGWEEGKTNDDGEKEPGFAYALRVTNEVRPRHVNLLLIANDDTQHYCWIKNFSRLVSAQYSEFDGELAYCHFCLHGFYGVEFEGRSTRLENAKRRRDEHEILCFRHGGQKTSFPENSIVTFKNIDRQVEAPFVVYADFESILKPMDDPCGQKRSSTKNIWRALMRI